MKHYHSELLEAVKAAVGLIRPHTVINELTSLPRDYIPPEMQAAEREHKVRVEGNIGLPATGRHLPQS